MPPPDSNSTPSPPAPSPRTHGEADSSVTHPALPEFILGIDLGTTNSLIAAAGIGSTPDERRPRCIPDEQGRTLLPSIVRFDQRGAVAAIGHEAASDHPDDALRTVFSVKRLMGRSLADAGEDVRALPFAVVSGPQNTARVEVPTIDGPRVISPQEISAAVLRELRLRAEKHLKQPVHKVVITVPAYFDEAQRQATRDAARLAGLDAVRIINEPTAAALAYGVGLREAAGASNATRAIAVYDLGGGTFDVSILRITPGEHTTAAASVSDFFEVLATSGDTHLGGDDMDQAIVAHVQATLGLTELTPAQRRDLRHAARLAKEALTSSESATIDIDPGEGASTDAVRSITLTRHDFERLIAPLIDRTLEACARCVRDARVKLPVNAQIATAASAHDELSAVILVGGATRVPLVRRRVHESFALEPYIALNPDEVVALGAAVQAGVLRDAGQGSRPTSLLLDVLPLSLGIETVGGAMAKLIVRNSTVPARASEMFSTSVDRQTGIKINVLQGEREMAADCRLLGSFELKGIPPMPAGIPKLRVEFLVDVSGVLTVRAAEERSGKALSAQVIPNHGLTRDEVERIERDSLTHAREDMARHRVVDLISHSAFDLSLIEKQLNRHRPALEPQYASDLDQLISGLRSMINKARADWRAINANEFQAAKESLDRASMRLHEVSITESLRNQQP